MRERERERERQSIWFIWLVKGWVFEITPNTPRFTVINSTKFPNYPSLHSPVLACDLI